MVPEDYVHRIGRTGRAGVDGDAVSLVCVDEMKLLRDIERVLGHAIPTEVIEGFEPDPRIRPEPILRGGLGGIRPGKPRAGGPARDYGAPRPVGGSQSGRAQHRQGVNPGGPSRPRVGPRPEPSPNGAPRHGGRPGSERGFAGPRRAGQSIGNAQPRRPGHGPRPDQRRFHPGIVLPGERLARNGGRPRDC
jgi:ATP-dependent RNA helicase RhlE